MNANAAVTPEKFSSCIFFSAAGQTNRDPKGKGAKKHDYGSHCPDLAIIGGLNWGCVGLFRFDVIAYLFGGQTATVSRVIYTLVGLAAIWCISLLFRESLVSDKE